MIAEVVVGLAVDKVFDYDAHAFPGLKRGMRVIVEFGRKKEIGFVIKLKKTKSKNIKLKPVVEVLDSAPAFPVSLLNLSFQIASSYLIGKGEVLKKMLPLALRKKKKITLPTLYNAAGNNRNGKASRRVKYIKENLTSFKRIQYYKENITEKIKQGKKVLICVPYKEDAYRIRDFLKKAVNESKIALLFGTDKPSNQFCEWDKIRESKVDVCIGTRFSVFAPFEGIGLIIIEKENFYGYFQPEKPFYHLRDIVLMRGEEEKSDVILHSDVPSLSVFKLLKDKDVDFIDFDKEDGVKVKVFDLNNYKFSRYPLFSSLSLEIIRSYVSKGKKVVVFWHRKGFSYILRCTYCKEILKCSNCESPLVFSSVKNIYMCNKCGKTFEVTSKCPKCRRGNIRNIGMGSERVEVNLQRIFGEYKVINSGDFGEGAKDWDILLCTQEVMFSGALPEADLVLASGLDSIYSLGDYSAGMELFFLLYRLKDMAKQEFIIFTFQSSYYPIQALQKNWDWVYLEEFKSRKSLKLPPFFRLAKVVLRQKSKSSGYKNISALKDDLEKSSNKEKQVSVYGPLEENPFKKGDKFYYYLVVKARDVKLLRDVLNKSLCKFKRSSAKISVIIT